MRSSALVKPPGRCTWGHGGEGGEGEAMARWSARGRHARGVSGAAGGPPRCSRGPCPGRHGRALRMAARCQCGAARMPVLPTWRSPQTPPGGARVPRTGRQALRAGGAGGERPAKVRRLSLASGCRLAKDSARWRPVMRPQGGSLRMINFHAGAGVACGRAPQALGPAGRAQRGGVRALNAVSPRAPPCQGGPTGPGCRAQPTGDHAGATLTVVRGLQTPRDRDGDFALTGALLRHSGPGQPINRMTAHCASANGALTASGLRRGGALFLAAEGVCRCGSRLCACCECQRAGAAALSSAVAVIGAAWHTQSRQGQGATRRPAPSPLTVPMSPSRPCHTLLCAVADQRHVAPSWPASCRQQPSPLRRRPPSWRHPSSAHPPPAVRHKSKFGDRITTRWRTRRGDVPTVDVVGRRSQLVLPSRAQRMLRPDRERSVPVGMLDRRRR